MPGHFAAEPSTCGIAVTWDAVYGAYNYDLALRSSDSSDWTVIDVGTNRFDTLRCRDGEGWLYRVRASCGEGHEKPLKSAWTEILTAVAHPRVAPGPRNVVTEPRRTGFAIKWDPPEGVWKIDRYGVWFFDQDAPGSFPSLVGMRGNGGAVEGLVRGHRYSVAVETWTDAGVGMPSGAPDVVVGEEYLAGRPLSRGIGGRR
jgi:hypothetical protein